MNSLPGSYDRHEDQDLSVTEEVQHTPMQNVSQQTSWYRKGMNYVLTGGAALAMLIQSAGKVEAEEKPTKEDGKAKVTTVASNDAKKKSGPNTGAESKEVKKVKWFNSPLKLEDGEEWSPYTEHLKEVEFKKPDGSFRKAIHIGEDHDAEPNQEVYAPAPGFVFNGGHVDPQPYIDRDTGERKFSPSAGGWIMLEHDLGKGRRMYSLFMHCKINPKLKRGQKVDQSTVIAYVGDENTRENGMQPTRHLHFQVILDCVGNVQNRRAGAETYTGPNAPNRPIDTLSPSILMKQADPLKFAQEVFDERRQAMLQARR